MKLQIDENLRIKFLNTIDDINTNGDFKEGTITVKQLEVISEYGSFLSLVPENDYVQIAFRLLREIRNFNLSIDGYRFLTLDVTTAQKKAMDKDLVLAKKYYETILNSPSKNLVALVEQNIKDIEHKLNCIPVGNGIINYKDYQTIESDKYDDCHQPKKATKKDIKEWLNRTVNHYKIQGCSKKIKALTDNL